MHPKFIVNASFLEKPASESNGVLRLAREISIRLKTLDSSIQFICSRKIPENSYSELLKPIRIGTSNGALWEQVELPFQMYRSYSNYHLLNFNNLSPILYNKNISSVLDLTWKHFPETFDKKSRFYLSLMMPMVIRRAIKIITISNYSKIDILKNFSVQDEDVKVIYPGFYSDRPSSVINTSLLEICEFNMASEKYFLATMYKNPDRLIKAFKKLEDKSIKLVFFGKLFEDVFGYLLDEIKSSNSIVYLGRVSDEQLNQLYAHALAFIYPSLNEGFGMPPLEAMSCNCPVVVSSVASIPEVCGDAALYVNPYDVDDIYRAMKIISTDKLLKDDLIEKGKVRTTLFSYDSTTSELLRFLTEMRLY